MTDPKCDHDEKLRETVKLRHLEQVKIKLIVTQEGPFSYSHTYPLASDHCRHDFVNCVLLNPCFCSLVSGTHCRGSIISFTYLVVVTQKLLR